MPWKLLLRIAIFTGILYSAPVAAGTPKPIVPRPPEEIMLRGWLQRMNCAAHIWCWPTPVAKIALPLVALLMAAMMAWGLVFSVSSRYVNGNFFFHASI